jgi:hypothetical protein
MVERITLALVVALVVVAAVTSRAGAQPAPATQVEPPPAMAIPLTPPSMAPQRGPDTPAPAASPHWYGWQILLGDAAVFSLAGFAKNPSVAYGWVGSGPFVHFGHGNVGRGLGSAALRVGLPLLGVAVGAASASGCHGDWCGLGEVVGGGLIGMATAELIDVVGLAYDSAPAPAAARVAQHSHGVEVSPVVHAGRSGLGLDLVGRF